MGNMLEIPAELSVTTPNEFVRPPDLPFTCSDEELLLAVQMYLSGAALGEVATKLKVKLIHVKQWTSAKGWKFLEDSLRDDVRKFALSNVQRLSNLCLGQIEERLAKGDPIYGMDGEVIAHRAVRAKDLVQMAATLTEKMHDIEDRTGGRKQETESTLKDLADFLRKSAREKRGEVIDITPQREAQP